MTTATLELFPLAVPQNRVGLVRLTDSVRESASKELRKLLTGISGKKIRAANVDGAAVTFLSRSRNGDAGNPLFRMVALLILLRRVGADRERALGLLDWLRVVVDALWPCPEAGAPAQLVLHIERCPASIIRLVAESIDTLNRRAA